MTNETLLLLITVFIVKHFIVDFLLQTRWQYSNKHIFGHPGGIFHAWLHGFSTILIFDAFHLSIPQYILFGIGGVEWIIHYFIDWGKVNIGIHCGWKCNESESFWYLLGLDQFLHYMTYVGIIYYLLTLL